MALLYFVISQIASPPLLIPESQWKRSATTINIINMKNFFLLTYCIHVAG